MPTLEEFREGPPPLVPFSRVRLPAGLTLLIHPTRGSAVAGLEYWVRVGGIYEPPRLEGLSHFLEHMFFKGTPRYPRGEMDRLVKGLGGYNNASTSLEYTQYYLVVLAQYWPLALELLTDAIQHLELAPSEVELEREVIKEEIARREDEPEEKLVDLLARAVFGSGPYGRPVLGTPESLDRIGRGELARYQETFYRPAHLILTVSGAVEPEEVLARLEGFFPAGGEVSGKPQALPYPEIPAPPVEPEARVVEREVAQAYYGLGFWTPGRQDERAIFALEVLATLLGGGRSSRLYRRLIQEEQLVTAVSSWSWDLAQGGLLGITAAMPPENLDRAWESIFQELETLRRQGPTAQELERAHQLLEANFAYALETVAAQGSTLAESELLYSGAEKALDYPGRIRQVGLSELEAFLSRWVVPTAGREARILPRVRP